MKIRNLEKVGKFGKKIMNSEKMNSKKFVDMQKFMNLKSF